MAIFGFSSSNGFSSFNLNFECRRIRIRDIGDENQSNFSYVVKFPYIESGTSCGFGSGTLCKYHGYEELNYCTSISRPCITFFQG